jgi:DNA-binding transcriptional MerR regulator
LLLEKRLKPPAVIMQNQAPEIVPPRNKEKPAQKSAVPGKDLEADNIHEEMQEELIPELAENPTRENIESSVPAFTPIAIIAVKPVIAEKPKNSRGRKSIKEMSMEADLPEVPEDEKLFSKQYYGIGEVAIMFHVNTSLLRYWESEFDILKPKKNGKGDRYFRPDDIKNLQVIYHLLRHKKFTIEGAKDYLRNNKQSKEKFEMIKQLQQLKSFLLEMKAGL